MRRERQVLGLGETRGISSLISEMTLRERRALHEAVKGMILLEQSGSVDSNTWADYSGDIRPETPEQAPESRTESVYLSMFLSEDEDGEFRALIVKESSGWKWEIFKYADGSIAVKDTKKGRHLVLLHTDPRESLHDRRPYWWESGAAYDADAYPRANYRSIIETLKKQSDLVQKFLDADYNELPEAPAAPAAAPAAPAAVAASSAAAPAAPAAAAASSAAAAPDDISFALGRDTGRYIRPAAPIVADKQDVGFEIFDSAGNPILRKTGQGWKITARLSDDEVLAMVVPGARAEVSRGLKNRSRGQEYEISKEILLKPEIANSPAGENSVELKLKREGTFWTDPVIITDAKAQEIINGLGSIVHVENKRVERFTQVDTNDVYIIGDAYFVIGREGVRIEIPRSNNFSGFTDIFGYDSNIAALIAKAQTKAGKDASDRRIRIPIRLATEKSVVRMLSKSILSSLGIGAISFNPLGVRFVSDQIQMSPNNIEIFIENLERSGARKIKSSDVSK